jgi:hypothetical protein
VFFRVEEHFPDLSVLRDNLLELLLCHVGSQVAEVEAATTVELFLFLDRYYYTCVLGVQLETDYD